MVTRGGTITKVGLVALGYLGALAVAWLALGAYVASTSESDRQTYGAMFAFGDAAYFVAVFGLAAVPATALGLFFLRAYPSFWRLLSTLSVVAGAATVAVIGVYVAGVESQWAGLAPLWILAAPVLGGAFLLSGALAPTPASRLSLLGSAALQGAVLACVVAVWFLRVAA